jgi:hypothetical protein
MKVTPYEITIEVKDTIIDYLQEELDMNLKSLKAYEDKPFQDSDPDMKRLREFESIKLRDRVDQLNRHINVIKRMFPKK